MHTSYCAVHYSLGTIVKRMNTLWTQFTLHAVHLWLVAKQKTGYQVATKLRCVAVVWLELWGPLCVLLGGSFGRWSRKLTHPPKWRECMVCEYHHTFAFAFGFYLSVFIMRSLSSWGAFHHGRLRSTVLGSFIGSFTSSIMLMLLMPLETERSSRA